MNRKGLLTVLFSIFSIGSVSMGAQSITPKEAAAKVTKGEAILLDVREADELKEHGKAAPALSLPTSAIDAKNETYKKTLASLPKDKVIITYCRSGGRAERMADELAKQGYKTLNMGGFGDWKEAGLPVTK